MEDRRPARADRRKALPDHPNGNCRRGCHEEVRGDVMAITDRGENSGVGDAGPINSRFGPLCRMSPQVREESSAGTGESSADEISSIRVRTTAASSAPGAYRLLGKLFSGLLERNQDRLLKNLIQLRDGCVRISLRLKLHFGVFWMILVEIANPNYWSGGTYHRSHSHVLPLHCPTNAWRTHRPLGGPWLTPLVACDCGSPGFTHGSARRPAPGIRERFIS
jgi:hypothetical protein